MFLATNHNAHNIMHELLNCTVTYFGNNVTWYSCNIIVLNDNYTIIQVINYLKLIN